MKPKLKPNHHFSFEAIGTHWWIGLYQALTTEQLAAIQHAVIRRIDDYDAAYSRFRADSLVTAIAQKPGRYQLPQDSEVLLTFYRQLYQVTKGSVTPLVGQMLSDAGYDAAYSLQPKTMHQVPKWEDALEVDGLIITTTQPVLLDFGAAGKGYLVDLVSELLKAFDVTKFCVDAGGDMYCEALTEPLRIGLENPHDTTQAVGVANLVQGALCASSGARRAWADFTHIMDPKTQQSPKHIAAVWVTAATALVADGMATALYFASPSALQAIVPFEYAIMYADGGMSHSSGFRAEFFTD